MSTTALPTPPPQPPALDPSPYPPSAASSSGSPGRVAAIIGGSLTTLVAIVLIAAGGFLLWVDGQKDRDGFASTGTDRFSTATYAINTQNLDVDLDGAGGLASSDVFGKVRLQATARNGKRIFVGIARTGDVRRYLDGSAHATITDLDYSPFRAEYRGSGGGAPASQPWQQHIWAASSYGMGTRDLRWKVQDGDWSVVVMNADGSRGVDAGVRAGAELPAARPLGWSLLGGGIVLLLAGGALVVAGARGRRS